MGLHWYNNDFAHRRSLRTQAAPWHFSCGSYLSCCVKRTPLPTLAISLSVKPNHTCRELSSAEIAVCIHMHTAKVVIFLICIHLSKECFDLCI